MQGKATVFVTLIIQHTPPSTAHLGQNNVCFKSICLSLTCHGICWQPYWKPLSMQLWRIFQHLFLFPRQFLKGKGGKKESHQYRGKKASAANISWWSVSPGPPAHRLQLNQNGLFLMVFYTDKWAIIPGLESCQGAEANPPLIMPNASN